MNKILFILIVFTFFGTNKKQKFNLKKDEIIYITILGDFDSNLINSLITRIENFYNVKCKVLTNEKISSDVLSSRTKRIDADKILKKYRSEKRIVLLTNKDICVNEYGIFGYGYKPGNTSIVSTFRISKNKKLLKDRIEKILLHEIGHNFGLNHCESFNNFCFMNSAKHSIKTIDKERIFLCENCLSKLGRH